MGKKRKFSEKDTSADIEQMIYECSNCFELDGMYREEMQLKYIKQAFTYHYNKCEKYKNYCDTMKVGPEDIVSKEDLIRIPLIHSTLFKLTDVITCSKDEVARVCQSSGTKGTVSRIYRDEPTLERFFETLKIGLEQLMCVNNAYCINLGPSSEEAGDLWFAYAVSMITKIYPTENLIKGGKFQPERVMEVYYAEKGKYDEIIIIGAPIMVMALLEYMENKEVEIENCENLYFITAGGWKRYTGKSIQKDEFIEQIQKTFKGVLSKNVYDVYNMVELNGVFAECEYHKKHVLPWVKVQIINPVDMTVVEDGEVGLISYLDPSATSYPCFVLTDDLGKLGKTTECECGRHGQTLEIVRRITSVDSRGCALKIDKKYASDIK